MKLAWLTDIHLNFLKEDERINFYRSIREKNCDAFLITGDIAEAPSVGSILRELSDHVNKPIYFVLGNHDYYLGQIDEVKREMQQLTREESLLYWLPAAGVQSLDQMTILVGQDGWADGRLGDYNNPSASLNDSRMIVDLFQQRILGMNQLLNKMQQLADEDALQLNIQLTEAVKKLPKKIMILTHVPPFKEASIYKGKISNDGYLPFYASKATGDVLLHIAAENPQIDFLVLCGHTHGEALYKPFDNLTVRVGSAEYYRPEVREIIDTEKEFPQSIFKQQ